MVGICIAFWSPDMSIFGRGTIVFSGVRPSFRPSVCVSGLLPDNRSLLFSEIRQQNVFSYVVVHYKKNFHGKTFIAAPGGKKWLKTPQNAQNAPSVCVSGLLPDNRSLLFSEIRQQNVFSYVVVHYKKNFHGKTFIAAPGGKKWLKTPQNAPKWAKMTLFPS